MYIYVCIYMCIHIYRYMYIYASACPPSPVHSACGRGWGSERDTYVYISVHIYIYMYLYMYMYLYINIYIYIHMFVYVYTFIYIDRVCKYIYIHIYASACPPSPVHSAWGRGGAIRLRALPTELCWASRAQARRVKRRIGRGENLASTAPGEGGTPQGYLSCHNSKPPHQVIFFWTFIRIVTDSKVKKETAGGRKEESSAVHGGRGVWLCPSLFWPVQFGEPGLLLGPKLTDVYRM